MFLTKDCDLEVKDIDLNKRIVSGYFAAFGNVDSDGDMIMPGAFSKSIKENGPASNRPRIAHLLQHNSWSPIGKIQELREDSKGLFFVSKLSKATDGSDTLIKYQEGIYDEHSIGFRVVKQNNLDDYNELTELKLWEGSTVTWGANENTPVVSIKGLDKKAGVQKLSTRISKIQNLLKNGSLTDDSCDRLVIELEQIKTSYNSLIDNQPIENITDQNEPGFKLEGDTLSQMFKLNFN